MKIALPFLLSIACLPASWSTSWTKLPGLATREAQAASCRMLFLAEGPFDSEGSHLVRLDDCGASHGQVSYQIETDKGGMRGYRMAPGKWADAAAHVATEMAALENLPEEQSIRCLAPVQMHWQKPTGESAELTRCPAGAIGERIRALVAYVRALPPARGHRR